MTPEAQRIAIAEACGWKDCRPRASINTFAWLSGINPKPDLIVGLFDARTGLAMEIPSNRGPETLPDYLNDLNAVHEAEERLIKEPMAYCTALCAIIYAPLTTSHFDNQLWQGWWFVHATAAQRVEAILKSLDRWTE